MDPLIAVIPVNNHDPNFFNSDATCFSQTVWPAKQYNVSKIAWRCPGGEKKGN